jgi:hypothetical protein
MNDIGSDLKIENEELNNLSKREYFSMNIACRMHYQLDNLSDPMEIAKYAVELADALLLELEQ